MHFLDLLLGFAATRPRFFCDGWGDRALCEGMDLDELVRRRGQRLAVKLGPLERAYGGLLREGTFESPEVRLPACARVGRVKLLLPEGRPPRGVALHLAASGDQGFALRLRFAAPLLARGLGALVLENPYYGARKPAGQLGPAVRTVADLHLMAAAAFQEGRALLRWLEDDLRVPLVGVTGFSMGGHLAAMVGASVSFPLAVVPIAATFSPDSVFKEGVLKGVAQLAALCDGDEREEDARARLLELLARFSVSRLPAPACPEAAIVVGTAGDGFVPPADMRRTAAYWGVELRWIPAGHVTAVLRHQGPMRDAIADAFDRLEAAEASRRRDAKQPRADRALQRPGLRADGQAGRRGARARPKLVPALRRAAHR
jgi:dienelactone hydrolase